MYYSILLLIIVVFIVVVIINIAVSFIIYIYTTYVSCVVRTNLPELNDQVSGVREVSS